MHLLVGGVPAVVDQLGIPDALGFPRGQDAEFDVALMGFRSFGICLGFLLVGLLVEFRPVDFDTTLVERLLALCQQLLRGVRHVAPERPSDRQIDRWRTRGFGGDAHEEGIRAIQWTADERGLAGLGELQGLPWSLAMESFFEAWVEHLADRIARATGGTVRTGRERETVVPLQWKPRFAGSQRSLIPDVVIERADATIILDAKYKRHFEELERRSWPAIADHVRDTHRQDLLQVLAYASTAEHDRVTTCLVYPCREGTWASLRDRSRVFHRAELGAGERRIELVLAAAPIGRDSEGVVEALADAMQ